MRNGVLGAGAVALAAGAVVAWRYAAAPSAEQQFAMLDRYCTECHNGAELAGGCRSRKSVPDIHAARRELEKAVRKLRGQLMPPPSEPRPDDAAAPVSSSPGIEAQLDAAAATHRASAQCRCIG